MKNIGHWSELNSKEYSPIEQGVIIVGRDQIQLKRAEMFLTFLLSNRAKSILFEFGYETKMQQ